MHARSGSWTVLRDLSLTLDVASHAIGRGQQNLRLPSGCVGIRLRFLGFELRFMDTYLMAREARCSYGSKRGKKYRAFFGFYSGFP